MGCDGFMEPITHKPQLYTVADLAEILQVPYARAADLIRSSRIPAIRIGRQVRISPDALSAFIAAGGYSLDGGWRRDTK